MERLKKLAGYFVSTYKNWMANNPFQMSAAVSYYALFSFPALIIIIIQVVGLFFGRDNVKEKIVNEVSGVLGSDSAQSIESLIQNSLIEDQSVIAIVVGVATLLYGATGMFISLQKSLNTIWNVAPDPDEGFIKIIKDRLFSLSLILIIGFLLLISLVVTAIITVIGDWIQANMPDVLLNLLHFVNFLFSLALITVLFGMIFRILPDIKLPWKYVWLGAFVTSLLFTIGKSALGVYFGTMDPGSAFGAAGSVVLILLWVSYSCLILFFGAEFTKVYAEAAKAKVKAQSHAMFLD